MMKGPETLELEREPKPELSGPPLQADSRSALIKRDAKKGTFLADFISDPLLLGGPASGRPQQIAPSASPSCFQINRLGSILIERWE
jgi:hypothetical protein